MWNEGYDLTGRRRLQKECLQYKLDMDQILKLKDRKISSLEIEFALFSFFQY